MSRFDQVNFMSVSPSGYMDIWGARFNGLRFAIPASRTVQVLSGFEANLPALAHKYLGDQNLWWALLQYNGLMDPINDIRVGITLRIPDRTALIAFLEQQSTSSSTKKFVI